MICAAHSHSVYGRAFSTLGKELDMITQDSRAFYKDHAVYKQFIGVILAEEIGRNIAETLGKQEGYHSSAPQSACRDVIDRGHCALFYGSGEATPCTAASGRGRVNGDDRAIGLSADRHSRS